MSLDFYLYRPANTGAFLWIIDVCHIENQVMKVGNRLYTDTVCVYNRASYFPLYPSKAAMFI